MMLSPLFHLSAFDPAYGHISHNFVRKRRNKNKNGHYGNQNARQIKGLV